MSQENFSDGVLPSIQSTRLLSGAKQELLHLVREVVGMLRSQVPRRLLASPQGRSPASESEDRGSPRSGPEMKGAPSPPEEGMTTASLNDVRGSAFMTEPELSGQWEDTSSWLSMIKQSMSSSLTDRETLITELKQVLEAATKERSDWRQKVKAMRRFRIPPEPGHWHASVTSALTWRTREVEALKREITQLEMKQKGEQREMCQFRARQSKRSADEAGAFCSRSTMGAFWRESSSSLSTSVANSWATKHGVKRLSKMAPRPQKPKSLHVIMESNLGPLTQRGARPEVQPLGGLCSRSKRGNTEVYMWGWEPNDYCFQDQETAFSSYTLPDVPRLGHREAIVEAQLLHEVIHG
mmetsp:Transcript_37786/g.87460  ORF Transcript_37786/g.87460 Transcript_37786/m.87460 type:complete len:353 (+) Transcript_37786:64-1122(+)